MRAPARKTTDGRCSYTRCYPVEDSERSGVCSRTPGSKTHLRQTIKYISGRASIALAIHYRAAIWMQNLTGHVRWIVRRWKRKARRDFFRLSRLRSSSTSEPNVATSFEGNVDGISGVQIGPDATAFTRMPFSTCACESAGCFLSVVTDAVLMVALPFLKCFTAAFTRKNITKIFVRKGLNPADAVRRRRSPECRSCPTR